MKDGYHKHKGAKKAHPVSREHRSKKVKQYHDEELKVRGVKVVQPKPKVDEVDMEDEQTQEEQSESVVLPNTLRVPIDAQGYLSLDLDSTEVKGLKLTFRRDKRGKTEEVSMKIENERLSMGRRKKVVMQEEL